MNTKYLKINKEVNEMLFNALVASQVFEKLGNLELSRAILSTASKQAELRINTSGLNVALRDFWADKRALSENYE
jgi:hypothetical protein